MILCHIIPALIDVYQKKMFLFCKKINMQWGGWGFFLSLFFRFFFLSFLFMFVEPTCCWAV